MRAAALLLGALALGHMCTCSGDAEMSLPTEPGARVVGGGASARGGGAAWSLCSEPGARVAIDGVAVEPATGIRAGGPVTLLLDSRVPEPTDAGVVEVTAWFRVWRWWKSVYYRDGDLCGVVRCPLAGAATLNITTQMPAAAPSGAYALRFAARGADGAPLFCVRIEFRVDNSGGGGGGGGLRPLRGAGVEGRLRRPELRVAAAT